MSLLGYLIFAVSAFITLAVPTCKLSLWTNWKEVTCTGAPNTIYTALDYSGNCTMFPNDPDWTTYKLAIDVPSKTVRSFRAYNFKNCYPGNDLFFTQTPAPLDVCTPAYLYIGPSSNMTMGGSMFSCEE